jgi:hypothetical protein
MRSFDVEMSGMKRVKGSASWNSNATHNHKLIRKVAPGSNASLSPSKSGYKWRWLKIHPRWDEFWTQGDWIFNHKQVFFGARWLKIHLLGHCLSLDPPHGQNHRFLSRSRCSSTYHLTYHLNIFLRLDFMFLLISHLKVICFVIKIVYRLI